MSLKIKIPAEVAQKLGQTPQHSAVPETKVAAAAVPAQVKKRVPRKKADDDEDFFLPNRLQPTKPQAKRQRAQSPPLGVNDDLFGSDGDEKAPQDKRQKKMTTTASAARAPSPTKQPTTAAHQQERPTPKFKSVIAKSLSQLSRGTIPAPVTQRKTAPIAKPQQRRQQHQQQRSAAAAVVVKATVSTKKKEQVRRKKFEQAFGGRSAERDEGDEYDLDDDFIDDEDEDDEGAGEDGKWLEEIHRMTWSGKRASRPGESVGEEEGEYDDDDDDDAAMEATTEEIREEEEKSERIGRLVDKLEKAREEGRPIQLTGQAPTVPKVAVKVKVRETPQVPQKPATTAAGAWSVDLFGGQATKKKTT